MFMKSALVKLPLGCLGTGDREAILSHESLFSDHRGHHCPMYDFSDTLESTSSIHHDTVKNLEVRDPALTILPSLRFRFSFFPLEECMSGAPALPLLQSSNLPNIPENAQHRAGHGTILTFM